MCSTVGWHPTKLYHPAGLQVGPSSVGASEGFLGWIAYLGAANAGIPLSIIVKQFGWCAAFPCSLWLLPGSTAASHRP